MEGVTVIVIEAVEAHCPAVGVKVYAVVTVLFTAGDQIPVIPLFDVVGRALKDAPEQIADTCVNVGVTIGLTVIVTLFEVAGEPVKHVVALDVITHVITSLFANVVEEYVEAVAPEIVVPFFLQT